MLRLLLALAMVQAPSDDARWGGAAIECVRHAASCRVHAAREFELLPLWFFALELIAHPSWHSHRPAAAAGAGAGAAPAAAAAAAEAVTSLSRAVATAAGTHSATALVLQGSLWDSFGEEPPPPLQQPSMQLAARAFLLLLHHTIEAKAAGTLTTAAPARAAAPTDAAAATATAAAAAAAAAEGGAEGAAAAEGAFDPGVTLCRGSSDRKAEAAALLRCAHQPAFARMGFEPFFGALQAMAEQPAPTRLRAYKAAVVRTLLPMAPYLAGI